MCARIKMLVEFRELGREFKKYLVYKRISNAELLIGEMIFLI